MLLVVLVTCTGPCPPKQGAGALEDSTKVTSRGEGHVYSLRLMLVVVPCGAVSYLYKGPLAPWVQGLAAPGVSSLTLAPHLLVTRGPKAPLRVEC